MATGWGTKFRSRYRVRNKICTATPLSWMALITKRCLSAMVTINIREPRPL